MEYKLNSVYYLPVPLKQFTQKFSKKKKLRYLINDITNEYLEHNEEGFSKINDYLLKIFTQNIEINTITPEDETEIIHSFINMDSNFEIIMNEIKNLSWKEKRGIYIQYYSDISGNNIQMRDAIYDDFKLKRNLKKIDYAFYSYFNLYISLHRYLTDIIKKTSKSDIDNIISIATMLSTIFSTIVVAYFTESNVLTEDVIIDKMSELNVFVEPARHNLPKNIEDLLEKSGSVSIF